MHGERQAFAKMAENDRELRIGIEYAGEHDAQEMTRGVDREAPGRALQLLVLREISLDCIGMRHRRMEIDRHAQRFSRREDRPEFLLVEKGALRVAMDHRAAEAEFLDATLEFAHRGIAIGGG